MQTNLQWRVERLNLLYHRIITNHCIEEHQALFRSLIQQIKVWGYSFRTEIPDIDFTKYELSEHEHKLHELLGLMQMAKKYGKATHLDTFTSSMVQAERNLRREIYISLCKREMIKNGYFRAYDFGNKIDFVESGHWIDAYVLI